MGLFVIERRFAEEIQIDTNDPNILKVADDVGVRWLYSFLSADKKRTYCLYEAPNPDALREAARRLNIPADVITEVEPFRGPDLKDGLANL